MTIRPFQDQDAPSVIAVWHRAGQAAYRFLPSWQNLTLDRYRQSAPIAIQPFVIRQESPLEDGLIREWAPPDFGIDKHYGYAFQWFVFSALITSLYVWFQLIRPRRLRKR